MNGEQWQQIERLFHEAIELAPQDRGAFLNRCCPAELRQEIESLLAYDEPLVNVLEAAVARGIALPPEAANVDPAVESSSERVEETRSYFSGQRIGPYVVRSLLGLGGMGEVYSATDIRLRRLVALKLMRAEMAANPEGRVRFLREARVVAALSHAHIVSIFDAGEAAGRLYLAMEYVDGKPLRSLLREGPVPDAAAIRYAMQLASALDHAHSRGVLHRDIKPENILVTGGGAKLVDFGIAAWLPVSEGRTATAITTPGMFIGTLRYAAPEILAGQPASARSDLYSLGVVLFEMECGQILFDKLVGTEGSVAAAQCAWVRTRGENARVSREITKVIERSLNPDPADRFQSAVEMFEALQRCYEPSGKAALGPNGNSNSLNPFWSKSRWRGSAGTGLRARGARFWRRITLLLGLPACSGIIWLALSRQPAGGYFKTVPLTTYPGVEKQPSFSPDGTQVAFCWNGTGQNNFDIYVKALGPGPPLRLTTDPAEDSRPAWSPDGSLIAFMRKRGENQFSVILVPALGGPERKITDISVPNNYWLSGPFLSWYPDNGSLAIVDGSEDRNTTALFRFSLRTGEKKQLTFPPENRLGDSCAAVSPDGNTLAFCRRGSMGEWSDDIYTVALGTDQLSSGAVRLAHHFATAQTGIHGLAWLSDNRRLLTSSESSIWVIDAVGRRSATPAKLDIVGEVTAPTASHHGDRVAFTRATGGDADIWRLRITPEGQKPAPAERLIASTRGEFAQQYSPDGSKIAFESNRTGNMEIWASDSEGGNCTQLTSTGSSFTGVPTWSPDGRQIAFYLRSGEKSHIFIMTADGATPRRLTGDALDEFYPRWSRDGAWIYFTSNRTGTYQVWRAAVGGGPSFQLTKQGGFAASESPDRKWLYFTKNEKQETSLWRMPIEGGEETQVLESVTLYNYDLAENGIYYIARSGKGLAIQFFDSAKGTSRVLAPVLPGYVGLSISPDRKFILYTEYNSFVSELAMIENFR